MSEDWKPGDVAMVTRLDKPEVAIRTDNSPDHFDWFTAYGSGVYDDARRLVVIDPEDREQVERLAYLIVAAGATLNDRGVWHNGLAAALREFANPTPPKPAWTDGDVILSSERAYHRNGGEWQGTRSAMTFSDEQMDVAIEHGAQVLRRQSDEGVAS